MDNECVGCGCTDHNACVVDGVACHWLIVDHVLGIGVCSCCHDSLSKFTKEQERIETEMESLQQESQVIYKTDDGLLSIESFQHIDNSFRLSACGERIVIAFDASQVTVIDDSKNGTDIIELKIRQNSPIFLKNSQEASSIAEFIGVEVFCFDECGNDLVPV